MNLSTIAADALSIKTGCLVKATVLAEERLNKSKRSCKR